MHPKANNLHEDLINGPSKPIRIQFSLGGAMAETLIKLAEYYQCTPGDMARTLTIKVTNQELQAAQGFGLPHAKS